MDFVESQKLKALCKCGVEVVENSFSKFIMKVNTQTSTETFWKGFVLLGHVDDLFPFFLRHAKQIFPMLDCMDDLRKISDLRLPPNWSVCCSACSVFLVSENSIVCALQCNYATFSVLFSVFAVICVRNACIFLQDTSQWIKKKIRLYQLWKSLSWCGFSKKMFSDNVFGK